jgi:Raf kinase inhibitor-like YbhB/YbcL family protein
MKRSLCLALIICFAFSAADAKKGGKHMLSLSSPAFQDLQFLPANYTYQEKDANPPLKISNVPPRAKSLALVMDDPDTSRGTFVHWVVFDLPANIKMIEEDKLPKGAVTGLNSIGQNSYISPQPPPGKVHHYHFKLYALDSHLALPESTNKEALEKAMKPAVASA